MNIDLILKPNKKTKINRFKVVQIHNTQWLCIPNRSLVLMSRLTKLASNDSGDVRGSEEESLDLYASDKYLVLYILCK